MDSRERTFLALEHKVGDRIPIDFWATTATARRLERELDIPYTQFLDRYDVDLRYIEGPAYVGPSLENGEDIWGVKRSVVNAGYDRKAEAYSEVTEPPLGKVDCLEDIEKYTHWPSPDWFDYDVIEKQCEAELEQKRVVVFMGDRLNRVAQLKPAMYLRGTEEIFMDFSLREQIVRAILEKIREFYSGYTERILDAARGKIDIVATGDDFGSQNGLLVSPDMWRTHLKPGFAEYLGLVKSYGVITMHHTCGSVVDIISDMVECGMDILQSIQPEARGMSLADLKRMFGRNLCFQGGISIQKTMPYGSRDDIRNEVKSIADIAKQDGGYIFCTSHNIQADTTVENIVTLMEAYLEYGTEEGYYERQRTISCVC